jgi:xanthine dehydrogenase YagT iron-sulfur-binding subunit
MALGWLTRRRFLAAIGAVGLWVSLPRFRAEADAATAQTTAAAPSGLLSLTLTVNGQVRPLELDPRVSLLDAVREHLALTGTKRGCDHGQCGACTVLMDGRRVLSCLTLAAAAAGHRITTVEGLAAGSVLHPVPIAFLHRDAFQCGFCTSGQIVSAVGFLSEEWGPDPDAIREGMSGNICRCGAYPNIVAAIQDVRARRSP